MHLTRTHMTHRTAFLAFILTCLVGAGVAACKDTGKFSAVHAGEHVGFLVETAAKDVEEVRHGLPEGAQILAGRLKSEPALAKDLNAVRDALELARRKVQELRMAKSTFFALSDPAGTALRNDQEQDRMAGKSFFAAFPALVG